MNLEVKPHLKEIINLYRKVQEFESEVTLKHTYNILENVHHHYIKDDIDTVIDAFSKIFNLRHEETDSLKDSMRSGDIDFMRLRNNEASLIDDHFAILYILSRPFFRSIKKCADIDNIYWQEGRCPVCSAVPSLSFIEKDTQRRYCCSYCGSVGNYKRIGCPFCQNEDSKKISIMYLQDKEKEDYQDTRIDACKACKSYVKTFHGMPSDKTVEEMDLLSLPFDIVAQNKGFYRRSPNPVGIVRIT